MKWSRLISGCWGCLLIERGIFVPMDRERFVVGNRGVGDWGLFFFVCTPGMIRGLRGRCVVGSSDLRLGQNPKGTGAG